MYREAKISVFIIEDYKLFRMNLKAILGEDRNINVIGDAESAEIGLKLIEKLKPDVILMDLGLPGKNGLEATTELKNKNPNTKIIILSAHEEPLEVLAALHAGANGYYLSNYDLSNLADAIFATFHGGTWIDPLINKDILRLLPKLPVKSNKKNIFRLTERELEVLNLVVQGKTNSEIAEELIVSVHTAKAHVCKILQKLQVKDRLQAATKAIKENLI